MGILFLNLLSPSFAGEFVSLAAECSPVPSAWRLAFGGIGVEGATDARAKAETLQELFT